MGFFFLGLLKFRYLPFSILDCQDFNSNLLFLKLYISHYGISFKGNPAIYSVILSIFSTYCAVDDSVVEGFHINSIFQKGNLAINS